MHGFKSFANKEVMKLGQGITTVVGPNGCGKTNIVDAIRWVLGEQKYSILRSGKMEDVIFNGAENAKPLGVCEVAMTVHNNAGKLPIEYNDIEIARRVYRSGESEYYLNKTQCRLKDISDLFVDTGMGADAYSVIELKMIEQILSEKADDRRKMFEEAAGIHKYRSQKKSTLRKFEATKNDLERIKDIISEIEQKVKNLDLQLKRFKRHALLTENLEKKDVELAFLQIQRFQAEAAPLQKKIKEFQHLRKSNSNEKSIFQNELNQLNIKYKTQEHSLKELQKLMDDLKEQRERLRNNILVSSEKSKGSILTIERLRREKNNNFNKIASIKQLSLDFAKELTQLEPAIEEYLEIYKSKKEDLSRIEQEYKKKVNDLDLKQNERWEFKRRLADDHSLYKRTISLVQEKEEEQKQLKNKLDHLIETKTDLIKKEKKLNIEKNTHDKTVKKLKDNIRAINQRVEKYRLKLTEVSEEKYANSALRKSLEGQKEFYTELLESKEGFPQGIIYVLENPSMFKGVLGTVADMFQVDEKYRNALEVGLGDLSHSLITKDRSSAIKILKKVNELNVGDVTIIPLEEASNLKKQRVDMPNIATNFRRASDLVKTSKKLRPLSEYILGDLFVVDQLDKELKNENLLTYNIVDLNGNFSGNEIVLKNKKPSEHGNIMGRQEKLDLILNKLNIIDKNQIKLNDNLKDIENELKKSSLDLNSTMANLEKANQSSSKTSSELLKSQLMLKQMEDQIISYKQSSSDIAIEIKTASKSAKVLEPTLKNSERSLQKFEEEVTLLNEKMVTCRHEKEEFQQSVQEDRIKLIELESRRDQLKFKKTSGDETFDELKERQIKIDEEIKNIDVKKIELEQQISSNEKELERINTEIQKMRSNLDLNQNLYRETFENIEAIQSKISNEQQNREMLLENLKNTELEASEIQQQIRLVEERIEDRYRSIIPEKIVVDSTEEQIELAILKIQKSLENIGPVNMAVQDEYEAELNRFNLLSSQRDDLLESEENLRETIRKIDKVARKRFQETFDLIKSNFETLFKLFFDGGNASLKLSGDPDPLQADIFIDAQPPGKRNSSLRLLSSGEKALTAISLLFAIYQVKPSPYCILDEVDAPLDDVNIHKFTRVLSQFCDETQFIIVTHNKLTMEIADYMYGVTQEKKGVSRLVSVKFD